MYVVEVPTAFAYVFSVNHHGFFFSPHDVVLSFQNGIQHHHGPYLKMAAMYSDGSPGPVAFTMMIGVILFTLIY